MFSVDHVIGPSITTISSIHGCVHLNQRVITDASKPCPNCVVGDKEMASSSRLCSNLAWHATAGSPSAQSLDTAVVDVRARDSCAPVDPEFLTEHCDLRFQLVDSGVSRIAILDQRFAASEHCDSHDANDVEYRTSHVRVPVPGERQCFDIEVGDFGGHGGSGNQPTDHVASGSSRRNRHD